MAWYLFVNGEVKGPFDEETIVDWIYGGLCGAKVCAEGESTWRDLATHPPFETARRRSQPTVPPPPISRRVAKVMATPPGKRKRAG
jgi:hypothetical protein